MKIFFISLILLSALAACNKPKETKPADNAVTRYHKNQVNKIKKAKITVKNLNADIKTQEERAKKLKNE